MQPLTIDKIKQYYLPKNASRINNFNAASHGIAVYNDSIPLYNAIALVIDEVGVSVSATDISIDQTASTVIVQSSTGLDGTIPAASTTLAGVMTSSDKVRANSLITLSGVAAAATNLGTFTGTTIPNNATIKEALQALETSLEDIPDVTAGNLTSNSSVITVTGGTNSVLGSGTAVSFVPGNVNLEDLGGALLLSQVNIDAASSGDVITFDGNDLIFAANPTPDHNDTGSLQGGTTNEYYHLNNSVYTKLNSLTTDRLLGRDAAGSGEVEQISLTGSLAFTGSTSISLVNDSASPGNSYYYGTNSGGTKGFFILPTSVATLTNTDNSDIHVLLSGTTTIDIEVELQDTAVSAGQYGTGSDETVSFEVDAKGRLVGASYEPISIVSSQVSDFNEAVDDQVAVLLTAGTGVSISYNDGAGTLTISSSNTYTDEQAQDAVGTILTDSSNIDFTYTDATPSITADLTSTGVTAGSYGNSSGSAYSEFTVDAKGRLTSAGTRTIQITTSQVTGLEEAVDDRVSNLLVAGTDINITYNDLAGTLTIDSTAGGGVGAGYDTIQEEGSALTARTVLNFIGGGITAVDNGGSTRTDVSLDATLNSLAAYNTNGLLTQTAADTFTGRELTAGATNAIVITDGDGVAGNPEIEFDPSVVDINDLSGPLTAANGGTGLTALGTANQLLGVNAAAGAAEYKTLAGTSNQITVTHGAGSITLATPQNIHTDATPTFDKLTLEGSGTNHLTINGAGTNSALILNNGGAFANIVVGVSSDPGMQFYSKTTPSSASTGLSFVSTATTAHTTNNGIGTITFIGSQGSSAGVGGISIKGYAGETHTGTAGGAYLSLLTTPTTTNTQLEYVRINTSGETQFRLGSGVRFYDSDNSNYIAIVPPSTGSLTGNYTLTLPTDDGTSGQVLTTNGSGTLSWSSVAGAVTTLYTGDGSVADGRIVTVDGNLEWDGSGVANGDAFTINMNEAGGQAQLQLVAGATGSALLQYASNTITLNSSGITLAIGSGDFLDINLGSDATGDTYYRNASGHFTRLPVGTNGHVLTLSSGVPTWAASTGTPAGANYQVQYYNAGAFGADGSFNFDPTNKRLVVGHTSANGTLHARSHNSTGSNAILAEDSSGNDIVAIKSNGYTKFGNNETLPIIYQSASAGGAVSYTGGGLTIEGFQSFGASYDILGITHTELTDGVDGPHSILKLVGTYSPSSGSSGIYAGILINQTIDQTGTFSGDSYGIFVAPDLTSVEGNYTAVAVSVDDPNAYGFVQSGSSGINSFAGFTGIGTVAPSTELHVVGTTTTEHLVGSGSTPTVSLGAAGVVGTGATASVSGTDTGFAVTLNTGTGVSSMGVMFAITFAEAYATAPIVVTTPANSDAGQASGHYITSSTTTGFSSAKTTAILSSSQTYIWNYHVIGK